MAPDAYWTAVALESKKSQALDAQLAGEFQKSGMNATFRLRTLWEKRYHARKVGSKFMCLGCNKPKPKSAFITLRTGKYKGYVQPRCNECRNKRSHKRKENR